MTTEDLLNYFYQKDTIVLDGRKASQASSSPITWSASRPTRDVRHPASNELHRQGGPQDHQGAVRQHGDAGVEQIPITLEEVIGRVSAHDVTDPKTGEVLVETQPGDHARAARAAARARHRPVRGALPRRPTSARRSATRCCRTRSRRPERRSSRSTGASARAIRRRSRPRRTFFNNLFFNPERYDLSRSGGSS